MTFRLQAAGGGVTISPVSLSPFHAEDGTMPFVTCPHYKKEGNVKPKFLGKRVKCPYCMNLFLAEEDEEEEEDGDA
jgi:hypothetical protein